MDEYNNDNNDTVDELDALQVDDTSLNSNNIRGFLKDPFGKTFKSVNGKVSDFIKNSALFIAKLSKSAVFKYLIIPLIIIIAITTIIVSYAEESGKSFTNSVNKYTSEIIESLDAENLTEEEKKEIEEGLNYYDEKFSFVMFRLSDIDKIYEKFEEDSANSLNQVERNTSSSFSTIYGENKVTSSERIVNENDKLELYKHILLTEKYNFNNVMWLRYGHGYNGDQPEMQEDTKLGLRYPKDSKNTKLEVFVDLLLPYLQTWRIPLAMHSGLITKTSTANDDASAFTYSIIKNAYSRVLACQYNLQTYTLNTSYLEYDEQDFRSQFNINIEKTVYELPVYEDYNPTRTMPQKYGEAVQYTYNGKNEFDPGDDLNKAKASISNIGIENKKYVDFKNNVDESGATITTTTCEYNEIEVIATELQYNGIPLKYKIMVTTYRYEETSSADKTYKKNSDGSIVTNTYTVYRFSKGEKSTFLQKEESESRYYNQIQNEDGKEDPTKEDKVSDSIEITPKYYIKEAKTFDLITTNEFNYRKYSESDVQKRINSDSKTLIKLEEYEKYINEKNKIDYEDVLITKDDTLARVCEKYNVTTDISTTSVISDVLPDNFEVLKNDSQAKITTTTQTTLATANDIYTRQYGDGKEKGKRYIKRVWSDKLTTSKSDVQPYTVDDVSDYNADYEIKKEYNSSNKNTSLYNYSEDNKDKKYSEFNEDFKKALNDIKYYEGYANIEQLNSIDLMNSNSELFNMYLKSMKNYSEYVGYSRSFLSIAYNELKRLFREVYDKLSYLPYKYGSSLGFTELIDDAKKNINTSAGMFEWPVPDHKFVSYIFGYSDAYGDDHSGIDISIALADVVATKAGKVVVANDLGIPSNNSTASGGYGNLIVIEHDNGYYTLYAHLETGTFEVSVGDEVKKGEKLAVTGSSGQSSGYHLHYEVREGESGNYQLATKVDPAQFYILKPANGNDIEYDQLDINPQLRNQITMQDPYEVVGYAYSTGGMSLTTTELTKEEFINAVESYKPRNEVNAEFIDNLDVLYTRCQELGVNPEYAVVTAYLENNTFSGYGYEKCNYNYWNVGVGNGVDPNSVSWDSFEDALDAFCQVILSYQEENSYAYNTIMARMEEREAAGCNPEGYGTPDTLAGIQSLYGWLGDDHSGTNSGTGGMYYINIPGIIYETQEEIEEKCWSKHGTEGGKPSNHPISVEEQNNYTAWAVRSKVDIRNKIFGEAD